jgi:hypothetical protein
MIQTLAEKPQIISRETARGGSQKPEGDDFFAGKASPSIFLLFHLLITI